MSKITITSAAILPATPAAAPVAAPIPLLMPWLMSLPIPLIGSLLLLPPGLMLLLDVPDVELLLALLDPPNPKPFPTLLGNAGMDGNA